MSENLIKPVENGLPGCPMMRLGTPRDMSANPPERYCFFLTASVFFDRSKRNTRPFPELILKARKMGPAQKGASVFFDRSQKVFFDRSKKNRFI